MSRSSRYQAAFAQAEKPGLDLSKVKDGLAVVGVVAGLAAGFFWASSTALRNAFFQFFGETRFVAPLSYEDMIYQGFLGQLKNLVFFASPFWLSWIVIRELSDPSVPKLIWFRDQLVAFVRWLAPFLVICCLWALMFALQHAENRGREKALELTKGAELRTLPLTRISRKIGDAVTTIDGVRLGCSEKLCALYQPSGTATAPDAKRASGLTVLVPLEGLISISTGLVPASSVVAP